MDELEISGKLYISSKKAARQNKYHVDYIGQLIRAGKIVGTKVGRAWYVEAASLASYLNEDPAQFALKKNPLQGSEPVARMDRFSEKESEIEAPVVKIGSRVGLTYLSETDFLEESPKRAKIELAQKVDPRDEYFEAGAPVQIHKKVPPEEVHVAQLAHLSASLPRRQLSLLPSAPFLAKMFFGLVTLSAFVALFGVSYKFSYTASLVGGQEASAVTFDR